MKYLSSIQNFWNKNLEIEVPSTSLIYLYLLHKWHEANYENFHLSDLEISKALNISRNTVASGRQKLKENNYLRFTTKVGSPCFYTIISNENETKINVLNTGIREKNNPLPKTSVKEKLNPNVEIKVIKNEPLVVVQTTSELIIPSLEEFLSYAKSLSNYFSELDGKITDQYNLWLKNKWKNRLHRPITNWENSLKNILPYLLDEHSKELKKIPTIKPPSTSK